MPRKAAVNVPPTLGRVAKGGGVPVECRGEAESGVVVAGKLVSAHPDPAPLLELVEAAFDDVVPAVAGALGVTEVDWPSNQTRGRPCVSPAHAPTRPRSDRRSCLAQVVAAFRDDGPGSAAWQDARRNVARALLQLYPLRGEPHPTGTGKTNDRVTAATTYLHDHAHETVTTADIAAAAGLSVRGLQDTFQRELGCSPMVYLRGIRLDRARTELRTLPPGTASVADIARRCGFRHMGRFAAACRKRFSEYPYQTLHTPP